ncbi:hypothetical protein [Bacteroides sp.]|uniref:hypothetical protein n=1 Tax=Bacteroides sp. TaxID=29523 RepID=UPI002627674B|nr:hypothetical protein [Bacteroides sp.]MDD3040394.1 hypothetical protein [Bacteroides sp.]
MRTFMYSHRYPLGTVIAIHPPPIEDGGASCEMWLKVSLDDREVTGIQLIVSVATKVA